MKKDSVYSEYKAVNESIKMRWDECDGAMRNIAKVAMGSLNSPGGGMH